MVTSYRCMVLADGWDKGASPSPSLPFPVMNQKLMETFADDKRLISVRKLAFPTSRGR